MKLRIIAGTLKRRIIQVRNARVGFRPTLERTRESIAESLKSRLIGATICDLCAGSGAFGFEMISRGAARVDFVDSQRMVIQSIEQHARQFGVIQQCHCIVADARQHVQRSTQRYDIIYFDPPYDDEALKELVPELGRLLMPEGILLYEHRQERTSSSSVPGLRLVQTKRFGTGAVDFLEREAPPVTPDAEGPEEGL